MDIAGGKGIMLGNSNFLARAYQGAPIAITAIADSTAGFSPCIIPAVISVAAASIT
jgi:hypothetical protein